MSGGTSLFNVATLAVDLWDAEKKYYDFNTNSCTTNMTCGHYTQNVWAESTSVGCAVRA